MRYALQAGLLVFLALFAPIGAFSAGRGLSGPTYTQKVKVIVTFGGDIKPGVVEKYGRVLKAVGIINGVTAVIGRGDIDLLRCEEGVKDVALDSQISISPPERSTKKSAIAPTAILESTDIVVGWNLQEPGVAASDTPPDAPTSEGAWTTYGVDGTGVIIAILDTGVNYILADLSSPQYLGGYDVVNDDSDPMDNSWHPEYNLYGHGTLCATIACGQGDDKIKGVAPNASYYALKVLDEYGGTDMSSVIVALDWCVNTADPRPDIVNMSLGGQSIGEPMGTNLINACNAAYDAGIILVAATGNDASVDAGIPARYQNIIAVGGHAEDQNLHHLSNGGADVVAPGDRVPSMDMTGDATYSYFGTSYAAPHVAGIAALILQYAREHNMDTSPGYIYELIRHSALDMPLIPDPVFKGKGKARALESIDLIASNWPIDCEFEFSDYAFYDSNYPAYHIGCDVNQTITLRNITDVVGNTTETIENLTVYATQVYLDEPNEPNLPGDSVMMLPAAAQVYPGDANSLTLSACYTIPENTAAGAVQTRLGLEFNFAGGGRVMKVSYAPAESRWYAAIPGDLDLSNGVYMTDWSIFAQSWRQTACGQPDYCQRADIDRSGEVNWSDVSALARNWLRD